MSVANVAQAIGMMHEQVRPELPRLYQQDYTAWGRIKSRTDIVVVSSRPTRVPLRLLAGGKFRVSSPDGADIGLGSSFVTDAMTLVPVYFFQASQYTKATEINTNSDEKAIEDYAMLTMKDAMEQFNVCMESVLQGDGSNTLDTVVSLTNGNTTINTNNANLFTDNQDIDFWSGLGGVYRGTWTILSVDGPNNQLNLDSATAGVVPGDLMLVSGSAGVANSGLFGIKYWQVAANTGSVGNLARSAYPGKLTTPHVAGANQALTPAKARLFQAQMQSAMGIDAAEKSDLEYHMNTDMIAAWENVGLLVSSVIQNQLKGNSSVDMLQKDVPQTFAGRPVLKSIHATPGRIDGLAFKHWFRCENQPIDYYEVGGQTLFPTYGASGGLNTSTLFYLWTGVQLGNENVRAGVYGDGFAIPSGYFGH